MQWVWDSTCSGSVEPDYYECLTHPASLLIDDDNGLIHTGQDPGANDLESSADNPSDNGDWPLTFTGDWLPSSLPQDPLGHDRTYVEYDSLALDNYLQVLPLEAEPMSPTRTKTSLDNVTSAFSFTSDYDRHSRPWDGAMSIGSGETTLPWPLDYAPQTVLGGTSGPCAADDDGDDPDHTFASLFDEDVFQVAADRSLQSSLTLAGPCGPPIGNDGEPTPSVESRFACNVKKCPQLFPTLDALRTHREVTHHVHSHCSSEGCLHSFQYEKDLRRHHRDRHAPASGTSFCCKYDNCIRSVRGFKRKDAMLRHVRGCHSGVGGSV